MYFNNNFKIIVMGQSTIHIDISTGLGKGEKLDSVTAR
jgi:hypothetical protein